uniref:site-specific DNA-methyltransferase (adenine-specific) n=1 Tax=viral metagenome TaxID=1070528 RepID=A0A6C0C4T7_9ZZZZ
MPKYTCERCLKEFSQKSHYTKHQNKKIPCQDNKGKIEEVVDNIINKKLISNNTENNIINTMTSIKTMRYLGNKTDHLEFIESVLDIYKGKLEPTLFDGFGGTGSVTQYFNQKGYNVTSNDINDYSYKLCFSRNNIILTDLTFNGLKMNINNVLNHLNTCKKKGFIYENYSPNSSCKYERKYFTNDNAEIIDGIRCQIEEWYKSKNITQKEYIHLIAILIETASLYSNIPGTYGAFLKNWDSRALKTLTLNMEIHKKLLSHNNNANKTYNSDIRDIIKKVKSCDFMYLDPPYNERDYASYYHVLETISKYDNPDLKDNKTGTKKKITKSNWCRKSSVINELEYVIKNSNAKVVLLSYNNEGIMKEEDIKKIFEKYGIYSNQKKEVKRFKCNKTENSVVVYEYIHILERIPTIEELPTIEEIPVVDYDVLTTTTPHGYISNICCLEGMTKIPPKSIDLICCDLPYGLTECKWDTPIDLDKLWKLYNNILKDNGTIILFGKQPFTSRLVASNYKMFKYSLVWQKSKPGGFAQAPYKVLCEHEDILVFTYGKTTKNSKNRMTYNPQGTIACNIIMKGKTGTTEHRKGRKTQKDYVQTTTNYPRSILKFNNEGKVKHPTQKPLLLIENLIKTFSNENEVVLDNCMGSGTTAIACIKNNRKYIGFEMDTKYFEICKERITDLEKDE